MEEIQSLVDISHIVPPMKMGKAAVCGYAVIGMVGLHVPLLHLLARGIRFDLYSRIWHERYGAMLSYSCRSLERSVSIKAMENRSVGS
jgi:hypothetical protein